MRGDAFCPRCFLDAPWCLCAFVPRVETKTSFLVLRHILEAPRRTNSGRIAALALARCRIVDYGSKGAPFDAKVLPAKGAWLLYPGAPPPDPSAPRPKHLVVLDGSYRQARRMLIRVPELGRMPRLSFPAPPAPVRRLRRFVDPAGMATLEAMAHAIEFLEGRDAARPLHELFALFVERSVDNARKLGRRAR